MVNLPAVSLVGSPDVVYKVPISAKEYFLIENRNRDAAQDGARVTMTRGGVVTTRTFPRDTTGFNAFSQDQLFGVVTDVDDFDWSIPGGVSSRTHEFFDGGILIWHVDENVIDANRESATVNADPARRGVDLEEADGSQDIGQSYGFLSPGSGSEDGTSLDFWYQGNAAPLRLRSNAFTPSSNPNSLSNDFANSHISVSEFSARGPNMTLRIALGDEGVHPLTGYPKDIFSVPGSSGVLPADLDGDGAAELIVATTGRDRAGDEAFIGDGRIYAFRQDSVALYPNGVFLGGAGQSFEQPIAVDLDGDGKSEIAAFRHATQNFYLSGDAVVYTPAAGTPSLLYSTGVDAVSPLGQYSLAATPSAIVWGGDVNFLLNRASGSFEGVEGDPFSGMATIGATGDIAAIGDTVFVEFINYSRPREVRQTNVQLNTVASEVIRALTYDIEEKQISLQLTGDALAIEADEQLLRQVVFNLLLNAVQAVGEKGRIEFRASKSGSGEAMFEVNDDGPGVPTEQRVEIFKPYFTTTQKGTGLGLAVVQQICLAHGWEIKCAANTPRGACFRVTGIQIKSVL